jgi:hypothetical protein
MSHTSHSFPFIHANNIRVGPVAAASVVHMVLSHLYIGIMGSNPAQCMNV